MNRHLAADTFPSATMSQDLPRLAAHHRMPEVIMIGAAKSATTFLTRWIAQHSAIGLCSQREPNFFSHPERFELGLDWYSDLYQNVDTTQLAFDSSTGYTRWPQYPLAASRIAHYAPQAKLIYLMRNPVERAYSHYIHRWTKECHYGEPFYKSFDEHVAEDPMCIDSSNYRAQIEQYLDYFPAERLLCLFTFELRNDPQAVLGKICRFLEIDANPAPFKERPAQDNRTNHYLESRVRVKLTDRVKRIPGVKQLIPYVPRSVREATYQFLRSSSLGKTAVRQFEAPPLSDETRHRLREQFAESNAWVAQFTGQDLACWNE